MSNTIVFTFSVLKKILDFYTYLWPFLNFEPQELIKSVTHQRCESRVANIWMDNAFDLQTSISIGFLLLPSGMCVPRFI
jgi:hypothetical protein